MDTSVGIAAPQIMRKARLREGLAFPLGRHLDRLGRQFRAVFGKCDQSRALPVRRPGTARNRAHRAAGIHRRGLAWFPARRAPGHDLWLSRPWPLRAGATATVSIRTSFCSILTPRRWSATSIGIRRFSAISMETGDDLTFDDRDSAPFMPRCRVIDPAFTWGDDRAPRIAVGATVIYEMHVRGYTKLHPAVPEELRGTFRGLTEPEVLDHIRSLGVTAVELVADPHFRQRQPFERQRADQLLGLQHDRVLRADAPLRPCAGFRLRRIQGNGGALSRCRHRGHSRRRLQSHRRRQPTRADAFFQGHRQRLVLSTAAGPNSAITSTIPAPETPSIFRIQRVLQMVTDSLRYWVQEMHVDGFRFDLGTILARETHGFDEGGGFLDSCRQDRSCHRSS